MRLEEKKEDLIKKVPSLTAWERDEIINYFNSHPAQEKSIDWNNYLHLTYEDFKKVMDTVTKTAKKRAVKISGIAGLVEGTDYGIAYKSGSIVGYIPFTWEASKFIASSSVGATKTEGKWCTAYQKDMGYWNTHCGDHEEFLIYFVDYDPDSTFGKVAVLAGQVSKGTTCSTWEAWEVWQANDSRIDISYENKPYHRQYALPDLFFIHAHKMPAILNKARKIIEDHGGLETEETLIYEIAVSGYAEEEEIGVIKGIIYYELASYHEDGSNYEIEERADKDTSSRFTIARIDSNLLNNSESFNFLYDFQDFNVGNGKGIYVEYDDDHTPDDAESKANRKWIAEMSDFDNYEISHTIKKVLGNNIIPSQADYSFVIVKEIEIDGFMKDWLKNYFTFQYPYDSQYNWISDKPYGKMEVVDSQDNLYIVYYNKDYNYSKKAEWISNPVQRKLDRQQDLEFGL